MSPRILIRKIASSLILTSIVFSQATFAVVKISEIFINPQNLGFAGASDANQEFIELKSDNGGVQSLDGLTLIVLESTASNGFRGMVDIAISLDGMSTGSNGLLVLSDGNSSWEPPAEPETTIVVLPNGGFFNDDGGGDDLENDGGTYAIVSGYTGTPAQDLDTDNAGTPFAEGDAGNGTATLEFTPWTAVIDAIGVNEHSSTGSTEYTHGTDMGFFDLNGDLLGQDPDAVVVVDGVAYLVGVLDRDEDGLANGPYQLICCSVSLQDGVAGTFDDRRFLNTLNGEFQLTPGSANTVSPFASESGPSKHVPAMGIYGLVALLISISVVGSRLIRRS